MTPSKAPLPLFGTWKLASCESSMPELPHPASGITTFAQAGDVVHYTSDGVWTDGGHRSVMATIPLDGTWCAVAGSAVTDSLSMTQLPDGSFEAKGKKGGDDVVTTALTFSADGQTMMGHWIFIGPNDTTITWKTTHERQ